MDVGVRELKQHLSEYLDRAAAGEVIRVTDRGHPKVVISPLAGSGRLQLGIAEGWIREPQTTSGFGPVQRFRSEHRVVNVLNDDRGE